MWKTWKRIGFCTVSTGVLSATAYFNTSDGTFQIWYGIFWWLMVMAGLLFGIGNRICLKGKWRLSPRAQLVAFLVGLAVTGFAASGRLATHRGWGQLMYGVSLVFMYWDGVAKGWRVER